MRKSVLCPVACFIVLLSALPAFAGTLAEEVWSRKFRAVFFGDEGLTLLLLILVACVGIGWSAARTALARLGWIQISAFLVLLAVGSAIAGYIWFEPNALYHSSLRWQNWDYLEVAFHNLLRSLAITVVLLAIWRAWRLFGFTRHLGAAAIIVGLSLCGYLVAAYVYVAIRGLWVE